jgi:hypothetical protein
VCIDDIKSYCEHSCHMLCIKLDRSMQLAMDLVFNRRRSNSKMADERLDLIVFGATGFTGAYVVKELCCLLTSSVESFTFGISGRDQSKLLG